MKADTLRNILRVVVNFYNLLLGGWEYHNLTTSLYGIMVKSVIQYTKWAWSGAI